MRWEHGLVFMAVAACAALAFDARPAVQKPQTAPTQEKENPNREANNRFVKQLAEKIAGHEKEPSEKVFKNMKLDAFKTVPAGMLLRVMNLGFSDALGVSCTHCHVETDFAKDDKRPKLAAREMAVMHRSINEQLAKMPHLAAKPGARAINCSTCHRGGVDPMAAK